MPERITSIAKNVSYFTLALILQKVISFTYFIILARNLVPEDLGKYYFAISFTAIFSVFIDLGLANVLIREVAKAKDRAQELLGTVLAIKIPLAIISLTTTVIIINFMHYPLIARQLVYLSAVCMILDSFTLIFYACIRGFHNLLFESVGAVLFQIIVLIFGFSMLKLGWGLQWLMGALVTASIFNFIYSASLVRFRWKIRLKPQINPALIKTIVIIAIPFGLFGILQRIYMYLDSVLLSVLAGDKYVGLYQIAFKIIFALQFLPMAFMASLYPAFASYWAQNRKQLVITFERAMNYLIIISLPISVGIIMLADKIILLFRPEYNMAILPLQLIMASLVFLFINFPIGSLLNACDKQKINSINMGITLAASIVMNIILIPLFQSKYGNGAIGASITVVATNFLMFLLGMRWVPKIIKVRPMKIISTFIKALFAVSVMAVLVLLLKSSMNIFVIILLAGLVYFVSLFLLGGFKKEDVSSIWRSFMGTNAE